MNNITRFILILFLVSSVGLNIYTLVKVNNREKVVNSQFANVGKVNNQVGGYLQGTMITLADMDSSIFNTHFTTIRNPNDSTKTLLVPRNMLSNGK